MTNMDHSNIPRGLDDLGISDIATGDVMAQILGELYKNCQGHLNTLDAHIIESTRYVTPGDPSSGIDWANHEFRLPAYLRDSGDTVAIADFHTKMRAVRDGFAANGALIRQLMLYQDGMDA